MSDCVCLYDWSKHFLVVLSWSHISEIIPLLKKIVTSFQPDVGGENGPVSLFGFEYGPLRTPAQPRGSVSTELPSPAQPRGSRYLELTSFAVPAIPAAAARSSSRLLPPPPRRLPSPPLPGCCGAEVRTVYPELDRLLEQSPVRETPTFLCLDWMDGSSCLRGSPCAASAPESVRIFWCGADERIRRFPAGLFAGRAE